jgi:YggT family protein
MLSFGAGGRPAGLNDDTRSHMQNALIFLVKILADLYMLTYLLRFVMQWVRADFYNPLAEFILRVTNPLVLPARRFVPRTAHVDFPTLAVLIILQCVATWALLRIGGLTFTADAFILYVLLRLINLALWFYTVSILVYVILSWIGQPYHHPIVVILRDLNEPLLGPVRRLIPPIGGLDLSPLLVLILIQAVVIMLRTQLPPLLI